MFAKEDVIGAGGVALLALQAMDIRRLDLDLHRLDLRFADVRLVEPRAVERIARSIEQGGQVVPCIAVTDPPSKEVGDRLVLVDGYRRVAALRRLGRDTAHVEYWQCDVAEALLGVLARSQNRPFAAVEEALQLRELTQSFGLSQHEIARRCGRDVSWVNRRLQLLSALSEKALAAMREGRLSSWAASRVMAPLARANTEHADQLLTALSAAPLSTRELRTWFEHYQEASHAVRDRMVHHPRLFISALQERSEQCASEALRDGPEGACIIDLRRINVLIRGVSKRLPYLCPPSDDLVNVASRVQTSFDALYKDIKRYADQNSTGDSQHRTNFENAGSDPERDLSSAQTVT